MSGGVPRVLHCIPGMGGGGAERQLAYLAAELPSLGWEVHVALAGGGPNLPRLEATHAEVHWLRGLGNHDPRLFAQLSGLLRRLRPAVVHTWLPQMDVLGGLNARRAGIPWVLGERSCGHNYPRTFKNRLRCVLARGAAAIACNSQGGVRYWQHVLGARTPLLELVPNSVPLAEISEAAPRGEPGPSSRVVLYAGRFSPEKRLDVLVDALRIVLRRPDTLAVLCGTGQLDATLRQGLAEPLAAGRALLPGYTDIWSWMKRADAFVSIGWFEGSPNAVLEALACGCPAVLSEIPGHREITDERGARFVPVGDAQATAAAILDTLDDRAAAAMRAAVGRAAVRGRSPAATAARLVDVYERVRAAAAPPVPALRVG